MFGQDEKINDYSMSKLEDSKIFDMLQSEKMESLKASIEDIQEGIKLRKQLSEEVIALFNKIVVDTENFIIRIGIIDRDNDVVRGEQMKLKQKLVDVESSKVQERVNCWRDVALMKKELREHLREYRDKESRSTMLDELIGTEKI